MTVPRTLWEIADWGCSKEHRVSPKQRSELPTKRPFVGPLCRFPSSPLTIRVPFFVLLGVNRGTLQRKKGKRVLLWNLALTALSLKN